MQETATTFSTAMGYITGAVGDMIDLIEDHALMLVGIAGGVAASGLGLVKSATGQRKRRGR